MNGKEGGILFRSSNDPDSAFRRALEIGEGYQGGCEEGTRRPRWVETRLAEVVTLHCLGEELKDETEVYWAHSPARQNVPVRPCLPPGVPKTDTDVGLVAQRCSVTDFASLLRRQKLAPQGLRFVRDRTSFNN